MPGFFFPFKKNKKKKKKRPGLHEYSLIDPEESLLVKGTTSPAKYGFLLVGEVVQPCRPGDSSW
jgi:hypothetical protein